jgi:hypothetical protein
VAVCLQFGRSHQPKVGAADKAGRLAAGLPISLASWRAMDEPIGATEAIRGAVQNILRYDDCVFRRYTRGEQEFAVYIAHWRSGKMSTGLVAEHTPDRCWAENGWRCDERRSRQQYQLLKRRLPPAEWRRFSSAGDKAITQHVLFWLIAGGVVHEYHAHQTLVSHALEWWRGAIKEVVDGDDTEKVFVRISSNTPFEQLWRDSDFQTVMIKVAESGLWRADEKLTDIR